MPSTSPPKKTSRKPRNFLAIRAQFRLRWHPAIRKVTMKPLHFDAVNPFTGKPFTWDDPNLFWGDPSYYLEPGDPGFVPYGPPPTPVKPPRKKPFRRKKTTPLPPEPNPNRTMSTFQYTVSPNSNGGFTTRPVRAGQVDSTALLADIAAAAGTTPEIAEAVLRAFPAQLLLQGAASLWSQNFLDLYTFRPTSGGSASQPDGFHNAADLNAGYSIALLAPVIEEWQTTLTLESQGEVGKVTPAIATIIRQSDMAVDKYTAGGLLQIRGEHLNFAPADLTQGVFFTAGAAAEVRASDYAGIQPQSVVVLVPAGLTGPLSVRVATYINGSVRSHTYTNLITTP